MLLKIAVCDDEAIHRLIIRDKLDKFAISNDVDYELDEFCTSEELLKIKNIYDILFLDVQLENGVNSIEIGKQLVEHIPAHRAQGEQPKVSLAISICFVHSNTLLFTCLCIIYYNFQQIATGKFMPPLYTGPKFDYNQTENHKFCSRSSGNCPGTAL